MEPNDILLNRSEQGGRQYNQDRASVHRADSDFFAVVADGVGGSDDGALAAAVVMDLSQDFWEKRDQYRDTVVFLNEFAAACNHRIREIRDEGTSTATTFAALLRLKGTLTSAHAGDSRVYQFDGAGQSVGHTRDHSLAYAKFLMGEISEEDVATHPGQTQLLNCLDGSSDLQVDITDWDLTLGEHFVLCTDGFWEMSGPQDMVGLIRSEDPDAAFSSSFTAWLANHPQHDNTTVVIARLGSAEPPAAMPATRRRWPWLVLGLLALVVIAGGYFLWIDQYQTCCAPPPIPASLAPAQPETFAPENSVDESLPEGAEPAPEQEPEGGTEGESGGSDYGIETGVNLNNVSRDTVPTSPGDDDIEVLTERLKTDGVVGENDALEQSGETKDEFAHIVKVQQYVNETPVFGGELVYRKVDAGLDILSGRLANLPDVPASPAHSFAECFSRYQAEQQQDGVNVSKHEEDAPALYIDAASSGYMWLVEVTQEPDGAAFTLFLLDAGCEALRLVPSHVSG